MTSRAGVTGVHVTRRHEAPADARRTTHGTGQTVTPSMFTLGLLSLGCALLVRNVAGFYLPGAAPHDYKPGEKVDLLVNALTPMLANEEHAKLVRPQAVSTLVVVLTARRNRSSTVCACNQWRFASLTVALTDDYYNPAFRFCQPEGGPKAQPERLGSILFGDRIFNSPFDVSSSPSSAMILLTFILLTIPRSKCLKTAVSAKSYAPQPIYLQKTPSSSMRGFVRTMRSIGSSTDFQPPRKKWTTKPEMSFMIWVSTLASMMASSMKNPHSITTMRFSSNIIPQHLDHTVSLEL